MRLHPRLMLFGILSVLTLAVSPSAALADSGNKHDLIRADFTPSLPTDPPINGIAPGGAPWVLDRGEVRVRDDGRMDVRLEGLQIPRNGGEDNPAASIEAVLYCGGMEADRSEPQPMSVPEGDARFRVMLDVPDECDMATVLIMVQTPNGPRYIASAMAMEDDD
jgi:hypothetical protein